VSGELQFERAQFGSGDHCVACQNPLAGTYFRLNENTYCPACAEKARLDHQLHVSGGGGWLRAALFGLGAAALGAIIYGVILVTTNYHFALIAIFSGWLVGKAMMRGSRGIGGRRFQVTAVLLTYLSITAGYVPSIVKELMNQPAATAKSGQAETATAKPDNSPPQARDFVVAFALLLGIAALAPFFELTSGVGGIITLLIILFGLMQAWKETREQPFDMAGPFPYEPAAPPIESRE
jgi:hypothetical protein